MSALAEALVAAQRRALSAMEKQYAAGRMERDEAVKLMDAIGATDEVDQDRLISSLDVIRTYGAQLPAEPTPGEPATKKPEPASDAQLAFLGRLLADVPRESHPALPLTKEQAHEIIDTLKAGTYDAAKWTVPF